MNQPDPLQRLQKRSKELQSLISILKNVMSWLESDRAAMTEADDNHPPRFVSKRLSRPDVEEIDIQLTELGCALEHIQDAQARIDQQAKEITHYAQRPD